MFSHFTCYKRNCTSFVLTKIISYLLLSTNSSCCSIFKDQVSLSAFCGQPCYYSTTFSVCQGVFQKFFELFSIFFLKPLGYRLHCAPALSSACIVYHTLSPLSIPFSQLFSLCYFSQPIVILYSFCLSILYIVLKNRCDAAAFTPIFSFILLLSAWHKYP